MNIWLIWCGGSWWRFNHRPISFLALCVSSHFLWRIWAVRNYPRNAVAPKLESTFFRQYFVWILEIYFISSRIRKALNDAGSHNLLNTEKPTFGPWCLYATSHSAPRDEHFPWHLNSCYLFVGLLRGWEHEDWCLIPCTPPQPHMTFPFFLETQLWWILPWINLQQTLASSSSHKN